MAWRGMATRELAARLAGGEAVTVDDVEAELWRRGLDAQAVDGVLDLVRRLASWAERGEAAAGGSQDLSAVGGGERLSQGVGAGGVDPELELAAELAAELAGEVAGRAGGTGSGGARARKRAAGPLVRRRVSPAPGDGPLPGEKACAVCGVEQPLADYYRDGNKADGRRATCKGCEGVRRALRSRELAAVRRVVREGGDPRELLAAIEERVAAERELRAATRGRVGADGRRVTPALDAATLAVVLAGSRE